jgi:hypothetical protein
MILIVFCLRIWDLCGFHGHGVLACLSLNYARSLCLPVYHHERVSPLVIASAGVLLLSSDIVRIVTGMIGDCTSILALILHGGLYKDTRTV